MLQYQWEICGQFSDPSLGDPGSPVKTGRNSLMDAISQNYRKNRVKKEKS
jgi:hypothetical protein